MNSSQEPDPSPVTDVAGACAYLKVSKSTLTRLVRAKKLKKTKIGKLTRFRFTDLRKVLDS
jgi:excisionase family DNA binding protein